MIHAIGLLVGAMLRLFRTRRGLLLENLALRQQLATLKRIHPRPRLLAFDKLFWVLARRFWSEWKRVLVIVSPELAQVRIHTILAGHFQSPPDRWPKKNFQGSSGAHLPDGGGKSDLGRTAYSR